MFRSCLILSRSAAVGSFELRFGGDILSLGFVKASTRDPIARQCQAFVMIMILLRSLVARGGFAVFVFVASPRIARDHNKLYLIIRLLLPHQRRGATLEDGTTEQMPITYNCRGSSWATAWVTFAALRSLCFDVRVGGGLANILGSRLIQLINRLESKQIRRQMPCVGGKSRLSTTGELIKTTTRKLSKAAKRVFLCSCATILYSQLQSTRTERSY